MRNIKKALNSAILLALLLTLTSCVDLHFDSLEKYKKRMEKDGVGYSNESINSAKYFLPSQTFISDYAYLEGEYHYFEEDFLEAEWRIRKYYDPTTAFLRLKYSEEVYSDAKDFVLEKIPILNEYSVYTYNDYVFYLNRDFRFPCWFTMVCYNDVNQTLIFLGYRDDHYTPKIDNWASFIDKYFGKYHDFSK